MVHEAITMTPTPAEQAVLDEIVQAHGDRILTTDEVEQLLDHMLSGLPDELQLPLIEGLSDWVSQLPDRTPAETDVAPPLETVH